MEPRMRLRAKGPQFPAQDLQAFLFAFGDERNPLPETIKVLDEIVTDFIIETSHAAALHASYARRTKIKVDDFKFVLRNSPRKLGRVVELLNKDKILKAQRRVFDVDEAQAAKAEAKAEARKEAKERERERKRRREGGDDIGDGNEGKDGGQEKKKKKRKTGDVEP